MRGTAGHLFSVFLIAASALSFSACTIAVNIPSAGLGPEPIPVREKLPVRAAIVITQAQRDAIHDIDAGADRLVLTGLAERLEESLGAAAAALFEAATVVRASPAPGTYDLVLAPRVNLGPTAEFPSMAKPQLRVAMSATLQVLDRSGKLLSALPGEGRETLAHGPAMLGTQGEQIAAATSRIVAKLVREWTEQLAMSRDLELYAKGGSAVQQVGVVPRPTSDIVISFSHPADGSRLPEERVTVMGLVSTSRGVGRLELAVNGRPVPVSRDVRVQSTDVKSHPFTAQVPLQPGQNLITLTAIDAAGNAAQAVRSVFREAVAGAGTPTEKSGTGERWAVVIGIDRYRDPSIASLRYASADAEAVFKFLTGGGGVKPENARLLLNEQATQRVIREVLGDFLRQKAVRDDEVIIYYAGHGTTEPDASAEGGIAKYLVPWDADPDKLFSSAIPMEEVDRVFGRLAARKILLIQDTCFSGGAGGRTFLAKGLARRSLTLTDKFLQELTQKEGRMILTASDVNQVSLEDRALRHGVFTYYLLEGLKGAADLDGDRAVTVRELHLFLQRRVHEHSSGVQTPQLYNIGDMVLTTR